MLRKSLPLISCTHYVMLYPQNDDRIVAIDTVTSLHPMSLVSTYDRTVARRAFSATAELGLRVQYEQNEFTLADQRNYIIIIIMIR